MPLLQQGSSPAIQLALAAGGVGAALYATHNRVLFISKQRSAAKWLTTAVCSRWHTASANAASKTASLELVHFEASQCKTHILFYFSSSEDLLCAYINIKTYFHFDLWVSSRVDLKLSASAILIKNKWVIVQPQGLLTQATYIKIRQSQQSWSLRQHHHLAFYRS